MARIRSVYPEICDSEDIAGWDPWAQIAWVKIWTQMDDKGRVSDSPRLLASKLFPLNDDQGPEQMASYIDTWERSGSVCRYQVDGKRYIHALHWHKFQRPQRPSPSKVPACPTHDGSDSTHGALTEPSGTEGRGVGGEKEKEGGAGVSPPGSGARRAPNCSIHKEHPNPPSCGRCKRVRIDWEKAQLDAKPALSVVPDFMRGRV